MKITELADRIAADVCEAKESWLAQQNEPDAITDIRNMVHGYRGDTPVVMLAALQTDRDDALFAAWLAAHFFGCDTIALTTESWKPAQQYMARNPYTGRRWGQDERSMQGAVNEWYALEEGIIVACLMTQVINRAADIAMVNQDYRVDQRRTVFGTAKYTVQWLETDRANTLDSDFKASGRLPESLVHYMNQPTALQQMARLVGLSGDKFGLDDVETMAHTDCGAIRAILGSGKWQGAIMLMSDDPRRSKIIHDSLGHLPNVLREEGGEA